MFCARYATTRKAVWLGALCQELVMAGQMQSIFLICYISCSWVLVMPSSIMQIVNLQSLSSKLFTLATFSSIFELEGRSEVESS